MKLLGLNNSMRYYFRRYQRSTTIFCALASINATIVGIIFAILVAFFVYSFQSISQFKEQLNDLRKTTAKIMHSQTFYFSNNIKDYSEYITKNKTIDYAKVKHEFLEIKQQTITVNGEVYIIGNENEKLTQDEIVDKATHFFDLITMIMRSSPYLEAYNPKKKAMYISPPIEEFEYSSSWKKELVDINGFLVMIWEQNKDGILKIFHDYNQVDDSIKEGKFIKLPPDHEKIILNFFNKVYTIQANVVPQVKDLSHKLNLFQEKFEVKKNSILILLFTIFILITGVFFPLFLHLHIKTPQRKIELELLCFYTLIYVAIIGTLLAKALSMDL